ncbi:YkoF family thiamine/hydroxymethylpyrimidine-binding protein [Zophobihabitans entericus]|uniref:Thiamin/hydroxymethyl pyrimidine-binding YkoF putative domain-containing protein n=1 Tax=Zophobihabitans entericus TaxID=1635327 RepID=A0A6G9IDQ1_9GAMM|nr:YkoF family thiamine/hydroxymethylpyrimidine-binding protein [Zophobihabitans entericus]QIQ21710.1 hypothetical protein IPMB12_08470 [Zophobihabitans entericus]
MSNLSSCSSACGTQGAVDVTGCRFSLYPMTDQFVEVIVSAIHKLNTEKVWAQTDHLSTLYRGKQLHVIDCVRAAFIYAYQPNLHMVSELTFSRGCPGDVDADSFLNTDDIANNLITIPQGKNIPVSAKISFYAFGVDSYMSHIQHVVELAHKYQLSPQKAHYVTMINGSASQIFAYFDEVLAYARQHLPHYVLEATLSVNSPSKVMEN